MYVQSLSILSRPAVTAPTPMPSQRLRFGQAETPSPVDAAPVAKAVPAATAVTSWLANYGPYAIMGAFTTALGVGLYEIAHGTSEWVAKSGFPIEKWPNTAEHINHAHAGHATDAHAGHNHGPTAKAGVLCPDPNCKEDHSAVPAKKAAVTGGGGWNTRPQGLDPAHQHNHEAGRTPVGRLFGGDISQEELNRRELMHLRQQLDELRKLIPQSTPVAPPPVAK